MRSRLSLPPRGMMSMKSEIHDTFGLSILRKHSRVAHSNRGMALALALLEANMVAVLCHGRYELLKAGVHGAALGIAAVCTAYNFAAWVARRQRHSWINATLYGALTAWEYQHVRHHLNCRVVSTGDQTDEQRAA
jgi:hypothetical protein